VIRERLAAYRAKRGTDVHLRSAPQLRQYEEIADQLARESVGKILDWGCGYGQISSFLRRRGVDVVAFDYRPGLDRPTTEQLDRYPEIVAHVSPDPVALPFDDATFDSALSCGVLEHVQDPDASLEEIKRVLKPGGRFYVFNLPNRYSYTERIAKLLGLYYHGEAPHDRVYTKRSTLDLFERHGYRVHALRRANMLPLSIAAPGVLYPASKALATIPGLNTLSTTFQLIATAPGAAKS
jgi:SAM-dependent methyltransferase